MKGRFSLRMVMAIMVQWIFLAPGIPPAGAQLSPDNGQPYTIGAWYFTGWSASNAVLTSLTKRHIGREGDPWGGVRDYALGHDPFGTGADYSDRFPLLGFYDQNDQRIMDTHILQAASRGLSFFAFYWYWDVDKNREAAISAPLHRFTTSPQKEKIRFMIAPITIGSLAEGQTATLEDWQNRIVPCMVDHYVSDPSYLRTAQGRPIINIFNVEIRRIPGRNAKREALEILRAEVLRKTGKEPLLLVRPLPGQTPADMAFLKSSLNIDGFQGLHLPVEEGGEAYEKTLSRWPASIESQKSFFHIPCTNTAADNRPWYLSWGAKRPDCSSPTTGCYYNRAITPGIFEQNLRAMKRHLDAHPHSTGKMLTVFAWNEWGEAGGVEPNRITGYRHLDAIRNVFGLSPAGPPPPIPLDTAPPSAPAGLKAITRPPSQIDLSWDASIDNFFVAGYEIRKNGTLGATRNPATQNPASRVSYVDTGIQPGSTIVYTVCAYDAAGNLSRPSVPLSVTVPLEERTRLDDGRIKGVNGPDHRILKPFSGKEPGGDPCSKKLQNKSAVFSGPPTF